MIHFAVRPRLTVRMLMLLIAVFGLFFGGGLWVARMWPRHIEAEREASRHAMESKLWSNRILESKGIAAPVAVTRIPITDLWRQHFENDGYDTTQPYFYHWYLGHNPQDALEFPIDPHFEELMLVCRARVAYHERMRSKWTRAAWMPWLRFEPDPPKPPVGEPDVSQSY
jgi:hypothetical protein